MAKFGIIDTADNTWIGDRTGPKLFDDFMLARQGVVKAEVDRSAEIARALIACREPVIPDRKFESDGVQFANLGCGDQIDWTMYRPSFCPDCGRPIKWE